MYRSGIPHLDQLNLTPICYFPLSLFRPKRKRQRQRLKRWKRYTRKKAVRFDHARIYIYILPGCYLCMLFLPRLPFLPSSSTALLLIFFLSLTKEKYSTYMYMCTLAVWFGFWSQSNGRYLWLDHEHKRLSLEMTQFWEYQSHIYGFLWHFKPLEAQKQLYQ